MTSRACALAVADDNAEASSITTSGCEIAADELGFLPDPARWSPKVAELIAAQGHA